MTEDPLAWETLDRRVAYTCEGFDVINEDVRFPDGSQAAFDHLSEPESVAILPFTDDPAAEGPVPDPGDREVILIEEWRQAVRRVNRGVPVGGTEPEDDDLVAAAHRELTEETGYVADRVEPLVTVEPANGIADSVLHLFVAYGCTRDADQELDYNESIRVDTTTLADLRAAVAAGEVRDGRAVTAVCYHQLHAEN